MGGRGVKAETSRFVGCTGSTVRVGPSVTSTGISSGRFVVRTGVLGTCLEQALAGGLRLLGSVAGQGYCHRLATSAGAGG